MDNLGRRSDPLDIVTKSDIDEIKLYKTPNAIIHGDPTINNGQISNFSAQNYLAFPFIFDFRDKAFVLVFSFTTSDDITTAQNVIGSNYCIAAFIVDGYLHVRASSNGTDYDIFDVVSDMSMAPNTTYYYMIKFDRLTYYIGYSTDGGRSFRMEREIVSTLVPKPGRVLIGLGNNGFNPFKGIINLNYWYLIENKVRFWDGMDDAGLSTRLATDLENIDDDGIARIAEIVNNTIAQADPDTSGIMKLYDAVGSNTDGTMTQKAITEALSGGGGGGKIELIFNGSVSSSSTTITFPNSRTLSDYELVIMTCSGTSSQNYHTATVIFNADSLNLSRYMGSTYYNYYIRIPHINSSKVIDYVDEVARATTTYGNAGLITSFRCSGGTGFNYRSIWGILK